MVAPFHLRGFGTDDVGFVVKDETSDGHICNHFVAIASTQASKRVIIDLFNNFVEELQSVLTEKTRMTTTASWFRAAMGRCSRLFTYLSSADFGCSSDNVEKLFSRGTRSHLNHAQMVSLWTGDGVHGLSNDRFSTYSSVELSQSISPPTVLASLVEDTVWSEVWAPWIMRQKWLLTMSDDLHHGNVDGNVWEWDDM